MLKKGFLLAEMKKTGQNPQLDFIFKLDDKMETHPYYGQKILRTIKPRVNPLEVKPPSPK